MTEYIKKEDALAHPFANGHYDKVNANRDFIRGHESYKEWLEDLPVADVVEVVRCKDCKHRPVEKGEYWRLEFPDEVCPCQEIDTDWYGRKPADDWFCANGKRNGDDSEAN